MFAVSAGRRCVYFEQRVSRRRAGLPGALSGRVVLKTTQISLCSTSSRVFRAFTAVEVLTPLWQNTPLKEKSWVQNLTAGKVKRGHIIQKMTVYIMKNPVETCVLLLPFDIYIIFTLWKVWNELNQPGLFLKFTCLGLFWVKSDSFMPHVGLFQAADPQTEWPCGRKRFCCCFTVWKVQHLQTSLLCFCFFILLLQLIS